MEREMPIKMIGNQDKKIKDDLRPPVTFTEDSSDEDESSKCAEEFSIEELESALFSQCEEDLPSNMEVVEPELEVSEDFEDTLRILSEYVENETATETSRTKLYEERMIDILLEDGTILDKTKLERETIDKETNVQKTVDERVIPITLDSGEVMKPLFTSFEELKPPTWSVFHKTGKEKKREIKIIKEPDSSVDALLERETHLTELHSEICNSEQSDTKPAENDIDSLWKELQELGSLPAKHKDEDTKEVTQHLQNNPTENYLFKIREKTKTKEASSEAINIPILIEEKSKDKDKGDSSKQTETHNLGKTGDEEMGIPSHLSPVMNLKKKERQIENCRNIKTLKSCVKNENDTTVPISIKIPFNHHKSLHPSQDTKSIHADPHHHCQIGGQDVENGGDSSHHSVSTQTYKNGCSVM